MISREQFETQRAEVWRAWDDVSKYLKDKASDPAYSGFYRQVPAALLRILERNRELTEMVLLLQEEFVDSIDPDELLK